MFVNLYHDVDLDVYKIRLQISPLPPESMTSRIHFRNNGKESTMSSATGSGNPFEEDAEDEDDDVQPLLKEDLTSKYPKNKTPRESAKRKPPMTDNGGASGSGDDIISDSNSGSEAETNPFVGRSNSSRRKSDRHQCGIFGWRPAWMQSCSNMYVFSALVGTSYFFSGMARMSLGAQLVSIERQFNIDSSKSGLFNSASHLGHMTTVLLVGYFARSINIPRCIGWAGIINGAMVVAPSILELSLPYKLPRLDSSAVQQQHDYNNQYLCRPHTNTSINETLTQTIGLTVSDSTVDQTYREFASTLAYYVLLGSMYLQGLTNSFRFGALPFVYIDDNVLDKTRTGIFLAIIYVIGEFTGPAGDLVNSWLSTIPVDLSDTAMQEDDPRFVSAWWLGFLVFGTLTSLVSMPILLLPRYMVPKPIQDHALQRALQTFAGGHSIASDDNFGEGVMGTVAVDEDGTNPYSYRQLVNEGEKTSQSKKTCCEMMKGIPSALYRTFSSPLYALLAAEITVIYVLLLGVRPFNVKYIMYEYNVSMSKTNMAKGLSSAITHVVGTSISSAISTRIKTRQGYIRLVLITAIFAWCVTPLYIVIGCDNQRVHGLKGQYGVKVPVTSLNEAQCSCDPKENLLSCGTDGVTYLSPCYAGCTASNGTMFSQCSHMSSSDDHSWSVEPGICDVPCWTNFILYNLIQAAQTFIFSINNMPRHLLSLRILHPDDRALGNSLMHFLPFLASLPAPLMFGSFIESMCLVWSSDHCTLYNRDSIRYLIGGTEIAVATITVVTYFAMLYICKWLDKQVRLKQRSF